MRGVTLAGLVGLGCLMACQVSVSTGGNAGNGGGGGARPARAPARQASNPPPPAPPPPARVQPNTRAPQPAPQPAAPAQPPQANRPSGLASTYVGSETVNVALIKEIVAKNPKPCGYVEVSPGNWMHVDCKQYKPSNKAIAHLSARKLKIIQKHENLWKPIRLASFKKSNIMIQGAPPATGGGGTPPFGKPGEKSEAYPGQVDHRTDNLEGPVKHQGNVGSCTAHSLSTALDNAAIRAGAMKPNDVAKATSAIHVWSGYGLPDMGAAADSNIARPIAFNTTWPHNNKQACKIMQNTDLGGYADECGRLNGVTPGTWQKDPDLMALYNKANAEGTYKISAIEKLKTSPPDFDEIVSTLASGADLWVAFLIDFPAWSDGIKNGVIPSYTRTAGGHAVALSGYRKNPQGKWEFLIHNSWGTSWGDKGYAWIGEEMMTKKLYYAYRVKITNGVKKEDLTDDDCAPDELIDIGTGLCAIMCANDSRPNNGCKN